jgi:hypothetical protein
MAKPNILKTPMYYSRKVTKILKDTLYHRQIVLQTIEFFVSAFK